MLGVTVILIMLVVTFYTYCIQPFVSKLTQYIMASINRIDEKKCYRD